MNARGRALRRWWVRWGAYVMAVGFAAAIFFLINRQYLSFHKRAPDMELFDQAIWNTLHGRFMFSTIKNRSILANHFSPIMILLAPLFFIWDDVRVLSLVQTIGVAAGGVILFKLVQRKRPGLAPWFLLAFYLNPALHEVALLELRRITLAVPFLALALYALSTKKRRLMAVSLAIALLCKEDVGLIVAMIGVYLLLFERDWRWGIPLIVVGGAWVVTMMLWIIPSFNPPGEEGTGYRLLSYFSFWGDSFSSILRGMLRAPWLVLEHMFDADALKALWRVFLPLGVFLPFLSPGWALITLPSFAYMLVSTMPDMHRLENWYMAPLLPVLFASIGATLIRVPRRTGRWLVAFLLLCTLIGFRLYSFAPLGGRYDPVHVEITDHARRAAEVVELVPADASIAAQDPYIAHLAHREHLYLYPWIALGQDQVDYFLLDRQMDAYPLTNQEINWEIDNLMADNTLVIEADVDGIVLLRRGGEQWPAFSVDRVAEDAIKLDRVEVALQDELGYFQTAADQPVVLRPGQTVRVSLYWEALATPNVERTVSVRIADPAGNLLAQQDMQPSKGARPTSWWEAGWAFRDLYYLTVSPDAAAGSASLDLLLYDSYTQDRVAFDGADEVLSLCEVEIRP